MSINASVEINKERDFWKPEEEILLKEWADKAQCFYWMHLKSYHKYKKLNSYYSLPVIIISTITGTAAFAQNLYGNYALIANMIIGSLNILAAVITTVHQFLKIGELTEGHKSSVFQWHRFKEYITIELFKNPLDRESSVRMIKNCSIQYSNLLECSATIPTDIIKQFKLKHKIDIQIPEMCGKVYETRIYEEKNADLHKFTDTSIISNISDAKLTAETNI